MKYVRQLLLSLKSKIISTVSSNSAQVETSNRIDGSHYNFKVVIQYKDDALRCYQTLNGKWGVLKRNVSGQYEELIPPLYDSAAYLDIRDMIVASKREGRTRFSFFFNMHGIEVISFEDYPYKEAHGNFIILKNGRYGTLNANLKIEIPCIYSNLASLSKDIYTFVMYEPEEAEKMTHNQKNGCGIINSRNQILGFFPISHEIIPFLYRDSVIVRTDDMCSSDVEHFAYNIFAQEKTVLPFDQIYDTEWIFRPY